MPSGLTAGYPAVDPGAPNCPVISFDGVTKLNDETGTVAKCDAVVYPYEGNSPVGTEWAFCWATTCLAILAAVVSVPAFRPRRRP